MYTMKIDGDEVSVKSGAPNAVWTMAIIDEMSGRVFKSQGEASKKFGFSKTKVSALVNGDADSDEVKLRRATVDEVKANFKIAETPEEIMRPRGKNKGTTIAEKKDGSRCVYRVRDDGRIEYRKPDDKNWGISVCCGKKTYRSLAVAEGVRKISKAIITSRVRNNEDGWRWAEELDVLKAWPKSTRVYGGETPPVVVSESFLAVTWPDGQVTVRAAVGTWMAHYTSADQVPAGVMEAAKVLC